VDLEVLRCIVLAVGAGLLVLGGVLILASRLGLGRLPGGFVFRGERVTVYLPLLVRR
jgi:hypothetical protein